ncbi:hypothetical protein BGZ97_005091 [Linnemannia gamsii]|uniref:Pentapeptide repeat-containing protein n=1 Tax=Linnemannia gamsii TaxID=64522 RepID=A0A9P6QUY4_9FUNG|nr:hypothetical protein BGZ97_005091 [Linnemannia gamsii]
MDLVRNPFLLSLTLEALPTFTKGEQNLSTILASRVQLYNIFAIHWLSVNKRRLESNTLSTDDRVVFDQLLDARFILMGIDYSTRLATAIFEKQDANSVVQYHLQDGQSWHAEFFGPDPVVQLLRDSAPLTRMGSLYRLLHRPMQEYFFSCAVSDPCCSMGYDEFAPHLFSNPSGGRLLELDCPLFASNFLTEPAIIQLLSERVLQSPAFKMQLLHVIEEPKVKLTTAVAAANAITILVRAGVAFHGQDLRGIRTPGADISDGLFDSAQLQGANLTNVNLGYSWLRQADLCGARKDGIQFGEAPYLAPGGGVFRAPTRLTD